jgi:hypothetical protein
LVVAALVLVGVRVMGVVVLRVADVDVEVAV